eukprot:scaffold18943_cov42-Phaeocystis_antarctica.AAC.1
MAICRPTVHIRVMVMGKAVIRRKGVKYANPKTPGHANLRRLHVYMHMHMCMCMCMFTCACACAHTGYGRKCPGWWESSLAAISQTTTHMHGHHEATMGLGGVSLGRELRALALSHTATRPPHVGDIPRHIGDTRDTLTTRT